MVKSGVIGDVISVDSTCTSIKDFSDQESLDEKWNSICGWGPTALFSVFEILGTHYLDKKIITRFLDEDKKFDAFTKIEFVYPNAVASIKIAKQAKSEGEMIITGTKGYIYVPSPWWKTDYFEIRFENPQDNRRCFYQLEGEGIRNEIVAFIKSIISNKNYSNVSQDISVTISEIIEDFYTNKVLKI